MRIAYSTSSLDPKWLYSEPAVTLHACMIWRTEVAG